MEDKKKSPKLRQKDIDKLYSIFLKQLNDKTLKTFEEIIEENDIKIVLKTFFDWIILEAIPEVNNQLIIPKKMKNNSKLLKTTIKCFEECDKDYEKENE